MSVINTSPLIHLRLTLPGGLALLPRLAGEVIIPHEVGIELAAGLEKDDTRLHAQGVPGLVCRSAPVPLHPLLAAQLDTGEAAVIQTALNEGLGTVILDERKARRLAITMGLKVTGTLGLLLLAKQSGHLTSLRAAVDTLRSHGIWLDDELAARVISLAGE
jgi:predicted nucleic acid-binding protein